jgi:sulfur carrier protein ThiS
VSREQLHKEFKTLLGTYKPSLEFEVASHATVNDLLRSQKKNRAKLLKESIKEKKQLEEEMDTLISLITNLNTSEVLRKQYEKKATVLADKIENKGKYRTAKRLSNPFD